MLKICLFVTLLIRYNTLSVLYSLKITNTIRKGSGMNRFIIKYVHTKRH